MPNYLVRKYPKRINYVLHADSSLDRDYHYQDFFCLLFSREIKVYGEIDFPFKKQTSVSGTYITNFEILREIRTLSFFIFFSKA